MSEFSGNWFQRRRAVKAAAEAANDTVMAAALAPDLYEQGIIPDTLDGRFHMVSLHAVLAIRAMIQSRDSMAKAVSDKLNTRVFDGFDHALRERGAGDSSIARKVRKLGERYYGLSVAVMKALEDDDDAALAQMIERNGITPPGKEVDFAFYIRRTVNFLDTQPVAALQTGAFTFQ